MTESLIEKMARAHYYEERQSYFGNVEPKFVPVRWEQLEKSERDRRIAGMRAAWAVAAEPTDAMKEIGSGQVPLTGTGLEPEFAVDVWQAMHGAAARNTMEDYMMEIDAHKDGKV